MEIMFVEVVFWLTFWFLPAASVYFICKYLNSIQSDEIFYMNDSDRSLFNAVSVVPIINIIISIFLFFILAISVTASTGER